MAASYTTRAGGYGLPPIIRRIGVDVRAGTRGKLTAVAVHDYHFTTHWQFEARPDEVWAILANAADSPRWWPAVYLEATQLEKGAADGVGQVTSLWTKGFLPYTLRWRFRVSEVERPCRLVLDAFGDFVGQGRWTLMGTSEGTAVSFDWRIRARRSHFSGCSRFC